MRDAARPRPTFEDVYRQHAPYVYRLLRRLGVAERHCEDALHEVFEIVLRRLPEYEPRDRITGWLAAIAKNVAAKQRHREHREPLMNSDIDKGSPGDLEQKIGDRDLLLRLLDTIELERRTVIVLHDLDDFSIPEIASALSIPEGTAWNRLRLARKDLEDAWSRMDARQRRGPSAIVPLAALIEAERPIPPMPEGVGERVWARLQRVPAPSHDPLEAPSPHVASSVRGSTMAAVAAGTFVLGVALGAVWSPLHRSAEATLSATPAVATATATAAPVVPAAETSAAPSSSASTAPAASVSGTASQDIAAERALMDKAGGALAANDTAGALANVEEHARRFQNGRLVEERESLWIATLLRAGRKTEARERIDRFARIYPSSARIADFRRALGGAGDGPR